MSSILMTLVATAGILAGPGSERVEVPIANRPETYTGAVGSFTVTGRAEPVSLRIDQAFQYVLQVTGEGDLSAATAPALERQPGFASDFELIGQPTERSVPGGKEFSYTLRPRSTTVSRVPPIRFSFYNPRVGRFETTIARSIPLVVGPADRLTPVEIEPPPPISPKSDRATDNMLTASTVWSVLLSVLAAAGIIGTALFRQRRLAEDALVDRRTTARGRTEQRSWSERFPDHVMGNPQRLNSATVSAGVGRIGKTEPAIERLAELLELPPGRQTSDEMLQAARERGIQEETLLGVAEALRRYDRARFGRSISPEETADALREVSRHVDEVILAMNARE